MERMRQYIERSPEELLEACLDNPEAISELSPEECAKLIELAQAKVIEIYEPHLKARYRTITQIALQQSANSTSNTQATQPPQINLRGLSTMRVSTCETRNLSQTALIGIDASQTIRPESCGYTSLITDKEHRFWINLKFFYIKHRDGTESRLLFIADWYVSPNSRGQGTGKRLQQLAQQIGHDNACSDIFCILSPEDPDDPKNMERLKETNRRMGYEISEVYGKTIARKPISSEGIML